MRKQTAIWVTKDKQRIRICDMTDSHLRNAIAMLERKCASRLAVEIRFGYQFLFGLQGEMAQFYCEQDIDRLEQTSPQEWLSENHPLYLRLCQEAERRKLYERISIPTH